MVLFAVLKISEKSLKNAKTHDFSPQGDEVRGLWLNGSIKTKHSHANMSYIFCPGEAVGTLERLGFCEPAYAGFAGPVLAMNIPLTRELAPQYEGFSHCMEVHSEGVVLAWQARQKDDALFIGVGGTKAFYGDKEPKIHEAFAQNRHVLQLNFINTVLPQCLSIALGYDTKEKILSSYELDVLERKGWLKRWVGRRAVAYDGFPTIGALYVKDPHNPSQYTKVRNARCTTHLGSGGVSFGPVAVALSRQELEDKALMDKALIYADSRREPKI